MEPVFTRPPLIAIEVLSPENWYTKVQEKVEDCRRFAAPHIWVIDPGQRVGWDCSEGNWMRASRFAVANSPIYLDLADLLPRVGRGRGITPLAVLSRRLPIDIRALFGGIKYPARRDVLRRFPCVA